jgi:aspartyl-tRNA(Asn)/glutamyl-tRNA(Gln) amidotransferase subunit C
MISEKEVLKLAALAHLKLSESEAAQLQKDLGEILEYVKTLSEAELGDVSKVQQDSDLQNVLREDEVRPSLSVEEALSNAPEQQEGLFKVPRVVDN